MLERTDRLALAVPRADDAVETYRQLFDTVVVDDCQDDDCVARRVTLQWGRDQLELFEPKGPGPVADFIDQGKRGIFAGGFSLTQPDKLAARLESKDVRVRQQGDDRYMVLPADLDGTGLIISKNVERERVGLGDKIWQITYAAPDLDAAVARYSDLFGIEEMFTNRYDSEQFGYHGAITWFDARDGGLLDSLEYLEPFDESKAVARFVDRVGNGIYMASIETDKIPQIRERVMSTGGGWQGAEFGGFIHPRRTWGLLLAHVTYENWNARRPLPQK